VRRRASGHDLLERRDPLAQRGAAGAHGPVAGEQDAFWRERGKCRVRGSPLPAIPILEKGMVEPTALGMAEVLIGCNGIP
jgi:hypothetical protein